MVMERLTAFEFIAATDAPQLVRLKRNDVVLVEVGCVGWIGIKMHIDPSLDFETREELTIEGQGLGHPYWNDEQPPWALVFDPVDVGRRIETIRAAARREINRASLSLM